MTLRTVVCGAAVLVGLTCAGTGLVQIGLARVPPSRSNVGEVLAAMAPADVPPRPAAAARAKVTAPTTPAAAPTATARTGVPQRLRLRSLGVDAAMVAVVMRGASLEVPPDPDLVGWWRDGSAPGAAAGPVVIDGHVDTRADGPGALFRLASVAVGDPVVLDITIGESSNVVRAVRWYPKAELPAEIFDPGGSHRVVLISCGGTFDRRTRHYSDNVVVYAVPGESPAP
jgi:hypothetical protein